MPRTARLSVAALSLAVAGSAQTQWLVGPGGYAQIRDVMPLVASGDTVSVASGTYYPFFCSTGITLRAVTPGTVTVAFDLLGLPPACNCFCLAQQGTSTFLLPPGQQAHVVGITFGAYWTLAPCSTPIHQILHVSGRVTLDQCTVDCLVALNASVHLQDCTVTSFAAGAGLSATGSDVTIAGGSVRGANAFVPPSPLPAFPAIAATNSRLHASGVVIQGGAAAAAQPGASGIVANGGSLWLVDATVTAGGGCAVSASGLVRIDRSTLNGAGSGCAVSPTGAALLGVDRNGPIAIGQLFQVTLTSDPAALLLVYAATGLSAPLSAPVVDQPIWIDPTAAWLADVAVAAPSGQTTFVYPVPAVPALTGAQFWLQGFGGTSFPLQTTPVVGGIVR